MQTVVTLSVALNVLAVLVLWEMVSTAQVRTYTVILLYARFMMCTNTLSSFECTCNAGFVGDGVTCIRKIFIYFMCIVAMFGM